MDDKRILSEVSALLDDLTKPKGSLGRLEDYASKLAVIQGRVPPRVRRKAAFVLAGDHGVVSRGVSLYPKEVTAQMFANIMAGGAGINVLSRACGFDLFVVDAGVDADLPDYPSGGADGKPRYVPMKAVRGTKDFTVEPAFTENEFLQCLHNGQKLADLAVREGYDIVALGDMGIGNTTSAAAVLAGYGFDPDLVVDRGTGIDDAALERKRALITEAVAARGPYPTPESVGAAFAGPEIAMAAGVILGLKGKGVACMLDGFPITAGAVIAWKIDPNVTDYLFAGHQSRVKGHRPVLEALGLEPVVSLDMRLGEGTGAVIGGFIVELGARIAGEMSRFSEAAVSKASGEEKDF
ncbi:MAG TPA: nicotinate-nucleotide--dimethylbenzimidazole phosphoribosyltransferase [Spirochaetales bacterium]|nr:nicotinate-nucleotide--dimethylbenzimidazole phosphoribosyltransferase [Spirochaetales bacterium]